MPDSMDWVKDNMRSCDSCGRETDAGEWPDWVNGMCEDCDPDILLNYVDCDWCNAFIQVEDSTVLMSNNPEISQSQIVCNGCYDKYFSKEENSNA